VRNDWIAENEDERLASAVSELRARYTVVVEANRDQP
jgi:lipoate synthase